MPTYIPVQGPQPDLPSTRAEVDPGWITYPKNLFNAVSEAPGKGGDVSVLTSTIVALPTPMEQNDAWQAVNKALGATVKMSIIPLADYGSKFGTIMAGNDLPDMFRLSTTVPELPAFLMEKAADLTPYLGGDAVKDYPNLANLLPVAWKGAVFNNAIYGIPTSYPLMYWGLFIHQELADQAGLSAPTNAAEFKQFALALTRPPDTWAIAAEAGTAYNVGNGLYPAMFGAPNQWLVDDQGTFMRALETDQYRAAVGYARDLVAAGVYHPNSGTYNNTASRGDFGGRKFAMKYDGWMNAPIQYWDQAEMLQPPSTIRTIRPFSAEGGKATYYLSAGNAGVLALKKAPEARIKELLGILNYLASPIGSQEYHLIYYGLQGVHHTFDDKGNPVLTPKGEAETIAPWKWLAQGPPFIFNPKHADFAPIMQADEEVMAAASIYDPTLGLYSASAGSKGVIADQKVSDGLQQIVAGRSPLTDFDQLVTDWRAAGGDQVRAEYEQAYAATQ